MTKPPLTIFARNLLRLMEETGWKATPLSLAAGLNRAYVRSILNGITTNPGIDATQKLAQVLGCTPYDLMHDGPTSLAANAERDQRNRRRALEMAERAVGADPVPNRAQLVFRAQSFIYDVIVEREERIGPVPDDDDEFWALLDSMARRHIRDLI